jgi:adenine-specific DNA-methyltransferase
MPLELPGPTGYCNKQLIPYLGNKRALLPRLMPVLEGLNPDRHPWRFLDPFSGSGSVSRLARAMGMRVEANDWEPYSEAINKCWLGLSPTDVDFAFGGYAGLASML